MNKKTWLMSAASLAMLATGFTASSAALAQDGADDDVIIVTGTRRGERSAGTTPAPVDVIGGQELVNQGDNDLSNILRTSIPSYNVNTQPISDAATLIRPANLRGLSPDNTLILLNGKRRHRAAVITFLGGGISDGSQGPDVSTIPAIALRQVEVLRDGASSQYGSDAIAGVINFILKDDNDGATLEAKYGSTYEGDGDFWQIAGNMGLPLGDDGFLNISAEFQGTDPTSRSTQRDDAAALIAAGNTAVADPAQIWGQPELRDDAKFFFNAGLPINDDHELYAFGDYASRTGEGGFFFRNPTNRGGVYAGPLVDPITGALDPNGVASVLVGDLSTGDTGDCPAGIPLTGTNGLIPDPTVLAAVTADPNCFSFVEMFPGGFTPRFGGNMTDMALAFGIRGEWALGNGLGYDLSFTYGDNQVDFFINNTINASLGPDTPTSFNPGGYGQTEKLLNLDFGYGLPVDMFASDLNVAFGFEWREEEFEVRAGDPASYALGPLASPGGAYPLGQGFSSSSNGFGGFTPSSEGRNSQSNTSYYVDLEADVTDRLTLQGAVRFEDYDAFGDTTNYKLGALFSVNDNLKIRGTWSTGFHAPTAGQANVINVTTQFSNGMLQDEGTFPLNSPAGQIAADYIAGAVSSGGLGLPRPVLGPEEAENYTLGAAFSVGAFDVTVDYFNIELTDRISRSSQIDFVSALQFFAAQNGVTVTSTTTGGLLAELDAAGALNRADFAGFEDLSAFAFFNNDFDTKTQGVDIVATAPLDFLPAGDTDIAFVINYTDTEVTDAGQTIAPHRVRQLEDNLPDWRGNVTVTHTQGPWRALARMNYYGEFYEAHLDDGTLPVEAGSEITFDAEAGYQLLENMELIVGARNIFDSYPDDNPWAGIAGATYPVTAPGGFAGGSYYVKARVTF